MRIKELIKEKGLTVAQVADKMKIHSPSLSRAINGNPTVDMLDKIAAALNVDIRELFGKSNEELYGLVEYKGKCYKIESPESLKQLLSIVEVDQIKRQ
jgi:transcriptional regulator with XRE-family HTH domain